MDISEGASCADKVTRLRAMLAEWKTDNFDADSHPMVERKRDIIKRRIFALEEEINYSFPLPTVEGVDMEVLYLMRRP